jgi:hypothetical protein
LVKVLETHDAVAKVRDRVLMEKSEDYVKVVMGSNKVSLIGHPSDRSEVLSELSFARNDVYVLEVLVWEDLVLLLQAQAMKFFRLMYYLLTRCHFILKLLLKCLRGFIN